MARKLETPVEAAAPGAFLTPTIMTMFARKISRTYPAFFPLERHQIGPKFGLIKLGFQLTVTSIPFSVRGCSNTARPRTPRTQINFHPQNQNEMPDFYCKIYGFFFTMYTLRRIYIQMTFIWYFHFASLLSRDQLLIFGKNIHPFNHTL